MRAVERVIPAPVATIDSERKVSDSTHLSPHRTLILALRRWSWDISGVRPGLDDGTLVRPIPEGPSSWVFVRYAVPHLPAAPVPVTIPSVPSIFWHGPATIPSCLAVQGILAAFYHARSPQRWTAAPTGFPTFAYRKPAGDAMISLRPAGELGRGEDRAAQAWQAVRRLDDLDGDVLLVALAQWLDPRRREADGTTWLTVDTVLDGRGLTPKMHRTGLMRERAGHRNEDRARVAESMGRLDAVWIQLERMTLLAPRSARQPTRADYACESKLLAITDRIARDGAPVAWRYRPGDWLTPFLERPNRQTVSFPQQALRYDPYRQTWEKRLARYLTFHLRMDAKNGRPLVRRIGPLLDELHLPVDRRHPERTRARFETALHRLARDGVINGWDYTAEARGVLARLPSRGWIEWWRGTTITITPPRAIEDRSASISSTPTQRVGI